MEARDQVVATMKEAQKPLKSSEIAKLSGLDSKEVDKVLKKLKTEDKIESPIRCFWSLK